MAQETQIGALYQPRGVGWPEDLRSISFGQGRTDTFLEGSGQPGGLSSNVWDTPWGQTTALLDCTRVRASTHARRRGHCLLTPPQHPRDSVMDAGPVGGLILQ